MEQYEAGAIDFTPVLTSEQNLFQAKTSLAIAMGNVPLGAIGIYRALGGGWQIRVDSNFVTAATIEESRTYALGKPAAATRCTSTTCARASLSRRSGSNREAPPVVDTDAGSTAGVGVRTSRWLD
jgi:hypothetical protein